jgi:hypothetical protein
MDYLANERNAPHDIRWIHPGNAIRQLDNSSRRRCDAFTQLKYSAKCEK